MPHREIFHKGFFRVFFREGAGQDSARGAARGCFKAKAELRSALQDAARSEEATGLPTGFGLRRVSAAFAGVWLLAALPRPFSHDFCFLSGVESLQDGCD
jgi:hypothetical protein